MADGMTFPSFPVPLPVIMKDEKEAAEDEAWKQYQEESLQMQEAALEQQIEYNKKGTIFSLNQIDLLSNISDKPTVKDKKEKQVKFWDNIFKHKIFENTLKGIKGIASSLGGGFLDTLIGLMLWAFIDPNGTLMISLINIFVSLSLMVIRMFARMIPVVLKMILKVLPVIINAISQIINTIIDVLPDIIDSVITLMPLIFNTLAKAIPQIITKLMDAVILVMGKLKEKFPFLKPLLNFIEKMALSIKELFDPNSNLGIKERLIIFAKSLVITFGEALMAGLKALLPLLGTLLTDLKDSIGEVLFDMVDSIHSYLLDNLGEKGMKALEAFGIAIGIIIGLMTAGALAVGVMIAWEYVMIGVTWLKTIATLANLKAAIAYTAVMWASIAPILLVILAVVAVIAAFVLLYTFWDDISLWFSEGWEKFKTLASEGIVNLWNGVGNYFNEAYEDLKHNVFRPIKNLWDGIGSWFSEGYINIKDSISNWISDFWNGIVNFFDEKYQNIKENIFKPVENLWNTISTKFNDGVNWFKENAFDILTGVVRLLLLPFTYPIEMGWMIYKNWEKIKKKITQGMKTFEQLFPNFSKWITDKITGLFTNIKIPSLTDAIFKAFDNALGGIPGLLKKAFSNIPGADEVRKSFEEFVNWFKDTSFYKAIDSLTSGSKNKPNTQFGKEVFKGISTTLFDTGDTEEQTNVKEAKKLLTKSNYDADLLRDILIGKDIDKSMYTKEQNTELVKAIGELKKQFTPKELELLQTDIQSGKDDKIVKAIEKLAKFKELQTVINFVSHDTVKKVTKRGE